MSIKMNKYTPFIAILFFEILFVSNSIADSRTYEVDAEQSYIHIYTGTSGFLKAVSHRHLIAIRDISGEITLDGENSIAALIVRPNDFLVDDDHERAQATDEAYQKPVAGWIKAGTKGNMNGGKLLETSLHPEITIKIRPNNLSESPVFALSINLKGKEYELSVPGSMVISEDGIHATGEFSISHSDLGLKQYSVPGGLSKVADSLRFIFDISTKTSQILTP